MNSTISALSTRFKLLLITILVLFSCTAHAKVLKGNISMQQDLPEDFYGTWSVISTLIDTNNPGLFRHRSADIWTFERKGEVITLSNPVSGATASITVNEVEGNTATFTRTKDEPELKETETPKITVQGDYFSGTDTIIMKHFWHGQRIKTDIVKYKIEGFKLSGPTLHDMFTR